MSKHAPLTVPYDPALDASWPFAPAPAKAARKQRISFEFNTRAYEFAHGRAPKGYGSWAFQMRTPGIPKADPVWAPSSTYSEAKRWFRDHVRTIAPADYCGHVVVEVCT